jgi:hypothetical protein
MITANNNLYDRLDRKLAAWAGWLDRFPHNLLSLLALLAIGGLVWLVWGELIIVPLIALVFVSAITFEDKPHRFTASLRGSLRSLLVYVATALAFYVAWRWGGRVKASPLSLVGAIAPFAPLVVLWTGAGR